MPESFAFDYPKLRQNFLRELTRASQDKSSSLSFIKHTLLSKPLITSGIVQGMVIGGTNYILSTEEIGQDGKRKLLERKTGVLPIFTTKKVLENFFSKHLDRRASAIGINFGFRMKPTSGENGSLDGFVQALGTKEHTFTGLTTPIGTLVKEISIKKYHKDVVVSVANDTICLLLSGDGTEQGAVIVGTGFNIGLRKKATLINLEAGGFDKFTPSTTLQSIDAQTKNSGKKLFEKSFSGQYLFKHFNEQALQLGLSTPLLQTSQELTAISHTIHDKPARDLARSLLKHSAYLVACTLAGMYDFYKRPQNLAIIGEGGLFWNGWQYQQNLQKKLIDLGIPEDTLTIKQIKDSSINGAIGLVT